MPSTPYPHVDGIEDWRAQQSIRLLWDQVVALQARATAVEGKLPELDAALAAQQKQIDSVQVAAGQAQAAAASAASAAAAAGAGTEADPCTDPTTAIIPMSNNAVTAEDQIKRSLAYYNRTDYSYWAGLVHVPSMAPWQGGDGKCYIGWDAYFEARASPGDPGSAGHDLLPLPAVHQAPVPPGYPSGGWT